MGLVAGAGAALSAGIGALGAGGMATLGSGILGAGASLATGAMNAGAASSAANAQAAQANNALNLQKQEFSTTQANLQPFMQAGQGALGQYQNLIGGNGSSAQQSAIAALQSNPLYLAETGAGNQAILANASATGGLRSGNANYNLGTFDANTLAQVYQQQIGNLSNLAGMGQNAAAGLGGLGANYAGTASNTMSQLGSAQAGGILGSSGAMTGGINSGLSQLLSGISGYGALGGFSGSGSNPLSYSLPNVSLGYTTPTIAGGTTSSAVPF